MEVPGRIVFIVGASGAGKDSLLRYAAAKLAGDKCFAFPHRVITRQSVPEAESHDSMTPDEFGRTAGQGGFALSWEAHGLSYGIPSAIDDDLACGRTVAVNVSRNILADAARRYPDHLIISVEAPADILKERLAARGREEAVNISTRLARKAAAFPLGSQVAVIVNDAALEDAGERLVALLRQIRTQDHRLAHAVS
jgi:ribose 1,5-bisphosphokinase